VGALEYALAEHSKKGTALSIEFLNWAGHTVANRTIDGGFFSELWAGYEKYGICSEAEMPYQARFDRHHTPTATTQERAKANQKLPLKLQWIKEWDPNTGATEEQLTQIKRTLAQKHPVCGGFRWPKNAEWKKNTLQMCPPEQVFDGHSILLVGYKDDPKQPGGGVFLIRNSAGGSRDGAIPYDYVRAYINDAAWIREIAPREEKRQREEPTQEEQE
jgi:C1A family cysteine protease